MRTMIAGQITAIDHWTVHCCSYLDLPFSSEATWMIDPPYEGAGKHYVLGATWLPFEVVGNVKTTRAATRSAEAVWLR